MFNAALQLSLAQRADYLDQACTDDWNLRRRVEALLEAHGGAGAFLAEPAPPGSALRQARAGPGSEPVSRDFAAWAEKPGDRIGNPPEDRWRFCRRRPG